MGGDEAIFKAYVCMYVCFGGWEGGLFGMGSGGGSLYLSLYLVLLFMDLWRIGKSLACVVDHPSGGLQMGEGNNNK
jgi:hypothetical protein